MPRPATRKPLPALFLFLISWLAIPCARSDEVIQLPTGVQTRLIAVSGRTLLVTVKDLTEDRVRIYERAIGGGTWEQVADLSNEAADSGFGRTLLLFEDEALIGAPAESVGTLEGYLYTFARDEQAGWLPRQRLSSSRARSEFGSALVAQGEELFVGAPGEESVHRFTRNPQFDLWVRSDVIQGPDNRERFGRAVAASGQHLFVGGEGVVFVYEQRGGDYFEIDALKDEERSFGSTLEASGRRLVVGAPGANEFEGEATIFERAPDGRWREVQKLRPRNSPGRIGERIALRGNNLLLGSLWGSAPQQYRARPEIRFALANSFSAIFPADVAWLRDVPVLAFDDRVIFVERPELRNPRCECAVGPYPTILSGRAFDDGDNDSGIASVQLVESSNVRLEVDPFPVGTPEVAFRVLADDEEARGSARIEIVDVAGNRHYEYASLIPDEPAPAPSATFGSPRYSTDGLFDFAQAIEDIDGDGVTDAVTYLTSSSKGAIRFGSPHGITEEALEGSDLGRFLAAGDFDGDGRIDVIQDEGGNGRTVLFRRNLGDRHYGIGPRTEIEFGRADLVGDFDGDGRLDLLRSGATLQILRGAGDGSFVPGRDISLHTADQPRRFVTGDWNRDGKTDVAGTFWDIDTVSLLLSSERDGRAQIDIPVPGLGPSWIDTGDVNGDGFLDLMVRLENDRGLGRLLGDGAGGFELDIITLDAQERSIIPSDLIEVGGDGKHRVLATQSPRFEEYRVVLLDVDGDAATPLRSRLVTHTVTRAVYAASFDGNDRSDILVSRGPRFGGNHAVVFDDSPSGFRSGIRTPLAPLEDPDDDRLIDGHSVDLDDDGHLDFVALEPHADTPDRLLLFRGDGTGRFRPACTLLARTGLSRVIVRDMDNDGIDDAILRREDPPELIYVTGDGSGQFEVTQVLETQPGGELHVADFDGNGFVDAILHRENDDDSTTFIFCGDGERFQLCDRVEHAADYPTIAVGDLDEDGAADLIGIRIPGCPVECNSVDRMLAAEGFAPVRVDSTSSVRALLLDANDDGHLDLVQWGWEWCSLSPGDGTGSFLDCPPRAWGRFRRFATGDFNLDGIPDLAGAGFSGFVTLLGHPEFRFQMEAFAGIPGDTNAFGDFDGDGAPDVLGVSIDEIIVVLNRTAGYECLAGNVGTAQSQPTDVLWINGSSGGEHRTVVVDARDPISATVTMPSGGSDGWFVVHADPGFPGEASASRLPRAIGMSCFPFILPGATPAAIWNNTPFPTAVGQTRYFGKPLPDPELAPTTFLSLPLGDAWRFPPGSVMTFQGIISDHDSTSPARASVTNGIVLRVE